MANRLEMLLFCLPRSIVFNAKLKSRSKAWTREEISLGKFYFKTIQLGANRYRNLQMALAGQPKLLRQVG